MSTDAPIEWLERLYASNAPEADWAQDLLGRIADAESEEDAWNTELQSQSIDHEKEISELEEGRLQAERERDTADNALEAVLQALGASDTEEAVAMARAMREAFES